MDCTPMAWAVGPEIKRRQAATMHTHLLLSIQSISNIYIYVLLLFAKAQEKSGVVLL